MAAPIATGINAAPPVAKATTQVIATDETATTHLNTVDNQLVQHPFESYPIIGLLLQ